MFMRFETLDGFTYEEVLIGFSVMLMGFALAEWLGRGFDHFPLMLGNGGFDRALVRPRGVIFQVLASKVEFSRFGRMAQAVIMLVYAPLLYLIGREERMLFALTPVIAL